MSKQSDRRNFFGKRNVETYQEPSSSGCSESDQSKSAIKTSPPKRSKNPIYSTAPVVFRWGIKLSGED